MPVEFVKNQAFLLGIVSEAADSPSDHRIVFLFHVAVVVFPITATSGKGDTFILAIPCEMIVDKFTAAVGVYSQQRKGHPPPYVLQSIEHPFLCLVPYRLCFNPCGADIRNVQGLGEFSVGIPSVMTDKIDLCKARFLLIPVRKGTNWDLVSKQSARFCVGPALDLLLFPFFGK
jgi:hypothetical protein